jgi:hypothetical protein
MFSSIPIRATWNSNKLPTFFLIQTFYLHPRNISTETFGDTNVFSPGRSHHRSEFPEYHPADSASHGKASNIGFEATFAKGGNQKNFATSEKQFPLP